MTTIAEVSLRLSEPIRGTYYVIVNYAYDHGGAVPTLRGLARMTNLPWQTLVYRMNTLCRLGLIRKIGHGRGMSYEIAGGYFSVDFHSQPFVEIGVEDGCVTEHEFELDTVRA